jgi:hypothetical protein
MRNEVAEPCHFHVQLLYTTWVIWGYGPRGRSGVEHIERAVVEIRLDAHPDLDMSLPFKLPKPYKGGGRPQEYERRECWGWRLQGNDYSIAPLDWHLAESREAALEDARAWCERQDARSPWVRNGYRRPMTDALLQVQEGM